MTDVVVEDSFRLHDVASPAAHGEPSVEPERPHEPRARFLKDVVPVGLQSFAKAPSGCASCSVCRHFILKGDWRFEA